MDISALTRSVTKSNHAVIAPDGYIDSNVPGWDNCTVNVLISEEMGAGLAQTLVTFAKDGKLEGETDDAQIFFYVVEGKCTAKVEDEQHELSSGKFVYVPVGKSYRFDNPDEGTRILTFHKIYEYLEGYDVPEVIFGDQADIPGPDYMGDPALRLQKLLPEDMNFDMSISIFTYDPGGHLPFVETHIMEHGLMFLKGQGVYMLDHQWYPIQKGDSIWMAPYCQQWFVAMGKEPAVYIYYKDVNRYPTVL